ncbi:pirin family protein [Rhizobium lusitanum]|uniref:pirin family protein n=1 Tax=Rhizobium lusitanum TaxID=293958 RepID=UPI00195CE782|nr:pirin family protein [Rhizobium lusitanum]MBM7045692.1 pirin family protein [Rhizobium lusitanum]
MLQHRPSHTLDGGDHGWLKARHHFVVTRDGNAENKALGALIVWNDDEIAPGRGFGHHTHSHMEIITYVREGVVTHEDSVGNIGQTQAGDVQVMSAGAGISHAERNEGADPLKIFQIWLLPRTPGGTPRWGSRRFPKDDRAGKLVPLASGVDGDEDALRMNADARVLGATLLSGQSVEYAIDPSRYAYLAPSRGSVLVNGQRVATGDGIAAMAESTLTIRADEDSEFILVDAA